MNRGVLEVENLMASGNSNLWYNNVSAGLKAPPPFPLPQPPTATYLPNFIPSSNSSSSSSSSASPSLPPSNPNLVSSWFENRDLPLDQPWSLSQLLLSGLMMGEEERIEMMMNHQNHQSYQEKKLDDWEEQVLRHQASMKQESNYYNNNNNNNNNNNGNYVIMSSPNSPLNKSCVTTTTIQNINEDHNNSNNHNGLNFTESNRSDIGGSSCNANKKPKLQVSSLLSSSSQSTTLKVRKEKLGGRIAALHQLVSPFGKTDTASVLSEAIGYIRFLHSQVEALSLPYFGTPSRNKMTQQHAQGDMNGIFPEDPGQLVNEYYMKRSKGAPSSSSTENQESNPNEESKKDLRSRGLCLVPISCTLQVGSDNSADYWAPAFGINFR